MPENSNIKLIVSDFDGVFTDRKLTIYSDGKTSKVIDYTDIMAIAIVIKKGIKFAIISGEKSAAIDVLASKFPMIQTFQDERNKIKVLKNLAEQHSVKPEEILYIGDDINDLECLKYVGHAYTVADAHCSVKELSNINVTKCCGGTGAFREIADSVV